MADKKRIRKVVVNKKRHTKGFVLEGGERVSRGEAVKLAKRDRLYGVTPRKGSNGWYLTSTPQGKNLYSRPIVVE